MKQLVTWSLEKSNFLKLQCKMLPLEIVWIFPHSDMLLCWSNIGLRFKLVYLSVIIIFESNATAYIFLVLFAKTCSQRERSLWSTGVTDNFHTFVSIREFPCHSFLYSIFLLSSFWSVCTAYFRSKVSFLHNKRNNRLTSQDFQRTSPPGDKNSFAGFVSWQLLVKIHFSWLVLRSSFHANFIVNFHSWICAVWNPYAI